MDFAIRADPALMEAVREAGATLRGQLRGVPRSSWHGGAGFPDLTAAAWLWGGNPETIVETLRTLGSIQRSETRTSQMLAFGRDGIST